MEYIQQYYQRKDEEIQKAYRREYVYLTALEVDRFVEESTERLFHIYKKLWLLGTDPDRFSFALDFIG